MAKLIDLTGATITFTDRLTIEKLKEFFNNNRNILLGDTDGEGVAYSMLLISGLAVYINGFTASLNSFVLVEDNDDVTFSASVESINGSFENVLIVNSNTGFYDIDTKFSNLSSVSNDLYEEMISSGVVIDEKIKFLTTYQPFIDFMQDTCDIEGGVWEEDEQLDTFLTEMGNAIREVKGTTGLINARDMAGIVRNFLPNVSEGTAIPRGEVVNKIWINPFISQQEIGNLLSQLTYVENPIAESPVSILFGGTHSGHILLLVAVQHTEDHRDLLFINIRSSTMELIDNLGLDDEELMLTLNGRVGVLYTSHIDPLTEIFGIPIGLENEKIKNYVSVTPFTA